MNVPQKTVVVIFGPTAIGKSTFATSLAQALDTEIISADSRQCFQELNIGVAKVSKKKLELIPHHFINSHSIHNDMNVQIFQSYCEGVLNNIFEKKNIAIVVGGTGFYIDALIHGIKEMPVISEDIKNHIQTQTQALGKEWLQQELLKIDPDFYHQADIENTHRMQRALAVAISTKKSIKHFDKIKNPFKKYRFVLINLKEGREKLYQNINHRVDEMMDFGLLNEVENLYPHKHLEALQTIGYKELFDYVDKKINLDIAIEKIKQHTRNYAKRQITWFKKYDTSHSLMPNELHQALEIISRASEQTF